MILNKLSALGLAAALLVSASTMAVAQDDTSKKLYLGVGNTSAEYWTQMIWGATQVMQSVGGDVEVIGNDFDPQKSLQNIGAITAPGCEGCIFTWFPDSPAFTKKSILGTPRLTLGLPTSRSTVWTPDTRTVWRCATQWAAPAKSSFCKAFWTMLRPSSALWVWKKRWLNAPA
jgi:hypothetical protein